jgi:hypothetical protein
VEIGEIWVWGRSPDLDEIQQMAAFHCMPNLQTIMLLQVVVGEQGRGEEGEQKRVEMGSRNGQVSRGECGQRGLSFHALLSLRETGAS